jgi:MOSC domain-containing protein YiiM
VRLLSVNVANAKGIIHLGEHIETGIFKRPVEGPVGVRTLNLEGDQQADLRVHGGPNKAVYVYSQRNIEFWRSALQREELGPGTFGENLTVDELTDDEVSIGDELEIGTARFLVTQPRLPCFKLGIALGDPKFPEVFQQSGRNGFYLRVLREGVLAAGDAIRLKSAPVESRVTIAEFARITNAPAPTPEQLHRILRLDALPQPWKDRLVVRLKHHSK